MILLDTQTLVWWVAEDQRLSDRHRRIIDQAEASEIVVSAMSVWEVAMLINKGRLNLGQSAQEWFNRISAIRTLRILPVTPQILLDSTQLPGQFHSDPADRIIVATARELGLDLLTTDLKILQYEHVRAIGPTE